MLKSFSGGVHPESRKSLSDSLNIEVMPVPALVRVPLLQHSGCPAVPVVKNGEEVITGGLIGKAEAKNSCNIFSPCCGKVKGIEVRALAGGSCQHIIIENNGKKDHAHLAPLLNPTAQQIIQRVFDCGVAGMGGAGFPTAAKLSPGREIEALLINGSECEPYITCDYRIMREYTEKFLTGALLMQQALGAKRVIVGVENNKPDAITAINDYITQSGLKDGMSVVALKAKFPQGSDRQLIHSLTGKKIAKGVRSYDKGIVVANVHTALSVYLAVNEGRQSYSRIVTVTGGALLSPKNIWAPIGASFKDAIEFCGGTKPDNPPVRIICGGPMMGRAVYTDEVSVTKLTGCILLLGKDEAPDISSSPCINCGRCAKVCPMNLMPMNIDAWALSGHYAESRKWGLDYCIECGCCSYICPAKRQIVQSVLLAKSKLKEAKK